ncbi:MAG: hypothetical protein WC071_01945 [Victivallaceae bacterium]
MRHLIASLVVLLTISIASGAEIDYPKSIDIVSGKLEVRLGAATYWNIDRVIYDKLAVSTDAKGYWGTVFQFPEIGFVGSGHNDKGNSEKVIELKMFADDKYLSPEDVVKSGKIKCNEFRLEKQAQVMDIVFNYCLIIKNDQLIESCRMKAAKDTPLKLMYNFMHPWSEKMTDYYIQIKDNDDKQGEFKTDEKFPHQGKFKWISLYDKNIQAGIVSKATGDDISCFLWDRKNYKKVYLCAFYRKTMIAGQETSHTMTTAFFKSTPTDWIKTAKELADKL